ncbi:MAG: Nuclear cap-binding protein subunit 2 [Marteilia pararefringens]
MQPLFTQEELEALRSGGARTTSNYRDKQYEGGENALRQKLEKTRTLYVGNLSFFTSEFQIYSLFEKAGRVEKVIIGLDRFKKTPCGFCFVMYFLNIPHYNFCILNCQRMADRAGAEACVDHISGTMLDNRYIRCDLDAGFVDGRQYGRSRLGGQVRDKYRTNYDKARGGFGYFKSKNVTRQSFIK